MTDIDRLMKKKKLTGAEIGKIMVKEMTNNYNQYIENPGVKPTGIITIAQREALVDSIDTEKDLKDYQNYRLAVEYFNVENPLLSMYIEQIHKDFLMLSKELNDFITAEERYAQLYYYPRIMTQKQYNEIRKKNLTEYLKESLSAEELFFTAVNKEIAKYRKGKHTELKKLFNKAEETPLQNKRIQAEYWKKRGSFKVLGKYIDYDFKPDESFEIIIEQLSLCLKEAIKDRKKELGLIPSSAPEDTTAWDVLEYAEGFYSSYKNDTTELFSEFIADYPKIYKEIMKRLREIPLLKDIPEGNNNEFFNEDLYPMLGIYENNILGYKDSFFNNIITADGTPGVAILQPDPVKGEYTKTFGDLFRFNLAEHFIKAHKKTLIENLFTYTWNIKKVIAIRKTVEIVADFIGIPEAAIGPDYDPVFIDRINLLLLNATVILKDLKRWEGFDGEMPVEEIREALKSTFTEIKEEDLELDPKNVELAKSLMNWDYLRGRMDEITDIIQGDNRALDMARGK